MLKPKILLVGEGDFSFAAAQATKDVHTVVATALTANKLQTEKQQKNIKCITDCGGLVFLDVDATRLSCHPGISAMQFERVQFNFPHVGGKMNIKANRNLVHNFFQSCRKLIELGCLKNKTGQVWVSLCAGQGGTPADTKQRKWHDTWQVVPLAASAEFVLVDVIPFRTEDIPGYTCTGYRSLDKGFTVEGALIHIFQHQAAFSCPAQRLPVSLSEDVEVQGEFFQVPSFYAHLLKRNLFEEDQSPIKQILGLAEDHLQALYTFTKTSGKSLVLNVDGEHSACTEKLVKIAKRNFEEKWVLRPSLISSENVENLVSATCSSYQTCRTFLLTDICKTVSPVQHQLWITWLNSSAFSPNTFLQNLLPEADIIVKSSTDSTENNHFLYDLGQINRYFFDGRFCVDTGFALCKEKSEVEENETQIAFILKLDTGVTHMCVSLESVAMVKYRLSDWRIMWTQNGTFCEQRMENGVVRNVFKAESIFPTSYVHDVSFWLPQDELFNEDRMFLLLRCAIENGLESVSLREEFVHPLTDRKSRCYRLVYRTWDGSLSKENCNEIHNNVREMLVQKLKLEIR